MVPQFLQVGKLSVRDHPFNMFAECSEKISLIRTPTYQRVRIWVLEMLLFRKILRTQQIDDPLSNDAHFDSPKKYSYENNYNSPNNHNYYNNTNQLFTLTTSGNDHQILFIRSSEQKDITSTLIMCSPSIVRVQLALRKLSLFSWTK